jgi:hypothetical protein
MGLKHIREYEDDDLKDLIGDLEGIGHKHRLIKGEDWGFGEDMSRQNDGTQTLFLSKFGMEKLEDSLKKDFGAKFMTNAQLVGEKPFTGFSGLKGLKRSYSDVPHVINGNIRDKSLHWRWGNLWDEDREKFPPYIIVVSSGNKKFPENHWSRTHKQMGKDRVKNIYEGIAGYIEKIRF